MNNKDDIRILTERFFNGETTIEEERLLYRLYQGDDVPQDLKAFSEMMLDMAAIGVEDIKDIATDEPKAVVIPIWQRPLFRWLAAAIIALAIV